MTHDMDHADKAKLCLSHRFTMANIEPRPDGRYNFIYGGLTLAVLDDRIYQGMGMGLGRTEVNPDLFGALALVAELTGGLVEYIHENVVRVFGEQ